MPVLKREANLRVPLERRGAGGLEEMAGFILFSTFPKPSGLQVRPTIRDRVVVARVLNPGPVISFLRGWPVVLQFKPGSVTSMKLIVEVPTGELI